MWAEFIITILIINTKVLEKPPIPRIHSSSDQPSNLKGTTSSNSQQFQSNPFHRDLCLPRVEVNKFDGSDPTSWVTQMEDYFSLHGITDDLAKLHYDVLYLDPERWQWWQWHQKSSQGYVAWIQFVAKFYECFDTDTYSMGCLTKLK